MCTKLLKQAKIDYFNPKFDNCRNDLKKTWHNINYLINWRRNTRTIIKLCIGRVDVTDEQLIANAFNDHFSSVGIALDRAIPARNKNPLDYRVRQNYVNQGLMKRYKFNSLSAINLTRVKYVH